MQYLVIVKHLNFILPIPLGSPGKCSTSSPQRKRLLESKKARIGQRRDKAWSNPSCMIWRHPVSLHRHQEREFFTTISQERVSSWLLFFRKRLGQFLLKHTMSRLHLIGELLTSTHPEGLRFISYETLPQVNWLRSYYVSFVHQLETIVYQPLQT